MECTMEIVEASENASSNNPDPCPPGQPPSHIDSPEVDLSSQTESSSQAESSSQVEPSSEADPSSQKPPSLQAPLSLPGSSTEAIPSSVSSNMTNGPAPKKQRLDYNSMSTGVYLDSTVVPILHVALVTLDRLRPADPVQFVIDFLLRHKAQYSKSKEQPVPGTSANEA